MGGSKVLWHALRGSVRDDPSVKVPDYLTPNLSFDLSFALSTSTFFFAQVLLFCPIVSCDLFVSTPRHAHATTTLSWLSMGFQDISWLIKKSATVLDNTLGFLF